MPNSAAKAPRSDSAALAAPNHVLALNPTNTWLAPPSPSAIVVNGATPRERLKAARAAEFERRRNLPENAHWRAERLNRIVQNADALLGL